MYLKETSEYGTMMAHPSFRSPYIPGCMGIEPITDGVTVSTMEQTSPLTPTFICQPTPKVKELFLTVLQRFQNCLSKKGILMDPC